MKYIKSQIFVMSQLSIAVAIIFTASAGSYAFAVSSGYIGRPVPGGGDRPIEPNSGYVGRPMPSAGGYNDTMIVAAGGIHEPGVSLTANGAQVVNIVRPNTNGLSHNQYQQFDVNKHGAVLNNSLMPGISQLAGNMNVNPNLAQREASIILNEVIGRNPSILQGQQEIFGKPADYVLANPNGISCQGCGFINTNSSSLVVGNPLVENGLLQGFSTLNNRNTLSINGTLETNGILELIAPKINNEGKVIVNDFRQSDGKVTPASIRAISGLNRVSRNGEVLSSDQTLTSLDSYYLGSMQAGRIHIINTAQGSGVKLAGSLVAGEELNIKAFDINNENQVVNASHTNDSKNNYQSNISGVYINDRESTQTLSRTLLGGKNISLSADNHLHLSATDIRGNDISLDGGKLTFDAQPLKQTQGNTNNQWRNSWQYYLTSEHEQLQQAGSTVEARGSAKLTSTKEDIKLLAAIISADQGLSIKAARNVKISGLIEKSKSSESGYKRNHTESLYTGSWSNSNESESLKASLLRSKNALMIEANNDVTVRGARVNSGRDLTINAGNQITVDVQKTSNVKSMRDDKISWGGIGGGNDNINNNSREISHASEITSSGMLRLNGKQGVTITGSKARGTEGGQVISTHGGLRIDNAQSIIVDKSDTRTGTAFNITSSSHKVDNSYQQNSASELKSDTNLKLISSKDIDVFGSQVNSNGQLIVSSLTGDINVNAAQHQQIIDEQKTSFTVNKYTNESEDKQFRAGLRIEHSSDSEKTTHTENTSSSLSGGSVELKAGNDVTFRGSKLVADKGDASISGKNVSFIAADSKTTSDIEQTKLGAGIYYTGGIDKVGNGVEGSYENSKTHIEVSKAISSSSNVKGDLTINARDKLTQQGAQHSIGGTYKEYATSIDHLTATDTTSSNTVKKVVGVDIGANVDYSPITRPIESAVGKVTKLDLIGALNDISNIDKPNVGFDISAQGGRTEKYSYDSQAVLSSLEASNIDITARDYILDQGTRYHTSNGSVNLTANNHYAENAFNLLEEQTNDTFGSAGGRVYTSTGSDINITLKGEGGTRHSSSSSSYAVAAVFNAADSVNINVKNDAVFNGTVLDGGKGKVNVNAGNDIRIEQGWDKQSENQSSFNAKASIKVGATTDSKNIGASLGGGATSSDSYTNTMQLGKLNALQGVELQAGRDLLLQGTEVTSSGDVNLTAGNRVALQAAESSQLRKDSNQSGKIDLGVGNKNSNQKTGGSASLGGAFDFERVNEFSTERQGASISSEGKVTFLSKGKDVAALHLQGAKVIGNDVALEAKNGGILLESVQNEQSKDNWNLGIKGNAKGSQSFDRDSDGILDTNSGKDSNTLGVGLSVGVEKLNRVTQDNTSLNAEHVTLNSSGDAHLSGARIDAGRLQGQVDGDLYIESRKDVEKGITLNIGSSLSHSNDPGSSITSKLSNIVTPHYSDQLKDKLDAGVNKVADTTTGKISANKNTNTIGSVTYNKADDKVKLPELLTGEKLKKPLLERGVGAAVGASRDRLTAPEGLLGQVKLNVEVVSNNAVEEQSAITAKSGVALKVGGLTKLTGGEVRSQYGKVDLGGGKVIQEDVDGMHYRGGGHVDLNTKIDVQVLSSIKGSIDKNVPVASGYEFTGQSGAKAEVFSGD